MYDYIDISKASVNRIPIAQEIKARIDKWDCMKLKGFCTPKEIITTMKRHPTEWEKFFGSYS
jgi:hypothetical protein